MLDLLWTTATFLSHYAYGVPPYQLFFKNLELVLAPSCQQAIDSVVQNLTFAEINADFVKDNFKMLQEKCVYVEAQSFSQNSLRNSSSCSQKAYNYSLLIQKTVRDAKAFQYQVVLYDLKHLGEEAPALLAQCGFNSLAQKLKRIMPEDCMEWGSKLIADLIQLSVNFDKLEWDFKHFKQIKEDVHHVRAACPLIF